MFITVTFVFVDNFCVLRFPLTMTTVIQQCKSLLLLSFVTLATCVPENAVSMGSEEGEVGGGNYSYFTISIEGKNRKSESVPHDFLINLVTTSGDSDLFVSGKGHKPTFSIGDHAFKSTTCGEDSVHIPASFAKHNSPFVVGVYGER
jgi:hypothetical protein